MGMVVNKMFLLQKWHFLEIGKHDLCSDGKENAHFRCNYLFWENVTFFCDPTKSPNTTKIGVSAGTRGKPKWRFWFQVPFWVFPSKGGFTICDTQKLCSAKNTIWSVFLFFVVLFFCCLCFCAFV